jgi:hypothetical protein
MENHSLTTQSEKSKSVSEILAPLSMTDSFGHVNLPKLVLPDWCKGPRLSLLPCIVDNSANIYWGPVFHQDGMSCGHASGIGLGFTCN